MLLLVVAALAGLGFAAASTWVHYQILNDPLYSSVCDVNATLSCTEAYTSRYGAVGGVPVALLGVLFFAFVLLVIALCQRSTIARNNLPGYIFAVATVGLAGVLYLAYASFVVLKTVCLLCVGTYAAIIALFLFSGAAARYPMSTLPRRASGDMRRLVRTPAALSATIAFAGAAVLAVVMFPGEPVSASARAAAASDAAASDVAAEAQAPAAQLSPEVLQKLHAFLAEQPRVPIVAAGGVALRVEREVA